MHDTTGPDISEIIDERPLGDFRRKIIILCACLAFVEGFDAMVAGFVAPALRQAWNLSAPSLGLFFSLGLFGIAIGALIIAPMADKIGRKPIIVGAVTIFGVGSLGMAFSQTLDMLYVFRFITGVGIGGALPNAISLTSEYSPKRTRSFLVVLMFNGFNVGAIVAGLATAPLVQAFGWRAVFALGGILPLLLLPVLIWLLPESVRFLAHRSGTEARVAAIMNKIAPGVKWRDAHRLQDGKHEPKAMSLVELFRDGRATKTLLLWLIFFMSLLDVYVLTTWLPTQIATLGFSVTVAIMVGTALQVGAVIGIVLGWSIDRIGGSATLSIAYAIACLSIVVIALAGGNLTLIFIGAIGAGFGTIGGQVAANAVASAAYPTAVRSTGVGWALGVGRVGSIIGPAVAGILIGMEISPRNIFLLASVPPLIAAVAAFGLRDRKAATPGVEAAASSP